MARRCDLLVIGTGVGGTLVAERCRKAGWSVAIADQLPYGGTCQLRGCDPKKVMIGVAETLDAMRRLAGHGIEPGGARITWSELMRFKRTFTDPVSVKKQARLTEAGIRTLRGRARFVGRQEVEVDGERWHAEHVLVATGARPMDLPIEGRDSLVTSTDFLDLDELPAHITFVGGGFISFELGHVAAVAGARVTIVEMGERPLAGFDPDLVDLLCERSRGMGIDVRASTTVKSIEKQGDCFRVRAVLGGDTLDLDADLVVHGGGRVPAIDDLGLEQAAVEFDGKRGVTVNRRMQSVSNPAVYAVGDAAAGGLQLTPVASREARVAAANLLGEPREMEYPPTPSVVFTIPPLAALGLSEAEARERGGVDVRHEKTAGWYSSRRLRESASGYKLIVDQGSGRVLGAHILGHGAEELINQVALAMRGELTARDIQDVILSYPSLGSDLQSMV